MKKILFGTSAMLAAAFASAGGASAAGLTLGVSGGYTFGSGFITTDEAYDVVVTATTPGLAPVVQAISVPLIQSDIRGILIADGGLTFEGKGTLDNGLTFGGVMKFDIENSGGFTSTDESYGYVSGSFGKVVVGHDDGAHDAHVVGVPCPGFSCAADGGGIMFDRYTLLGSDWGFGGNDTGDALKISYFTPAFSGFSAGVSWIPDAASGENGTLTTTNSSLGSKNGAYEIGAKFENTYDRFTVGLGGGYTMWDYDNNGAAANGDSSWAVGAKVGFSGLTVGGRFENDREDETGFGVGATYGTGPWTFGVSYAQGDTILDDSSITGTYAGVTGTLRSVAGNSRGVSVGMSYELGKGVVVAAGLEWSKYEYDSSVSGRLAGADGVINTADDTIITSTTDRDGTSLFGGGIVTKLSF